MTDLPFQKHLPMPLHTLIAAALLLGAAHELDARVIGTMAPAEPLTDARVAILEPAARAAWQVYLTRSRALMAADKAALLAERRGAQDISAAGPRPGSARSMPLNRPSAWYASAEARRIADNIVRFQTAAGGWGKNQDRAGPPRKSGQSWVPIEKQPGARDKARAIDRSWRYVATIDNGATVTELRFLARVQATAPDAAGDRYRLAFLKGARYLLAAEFPRGGWPQVYPLRGGYHDALTFNDDAVSGTAQLMLTIGRRTGDCGFVPADLGAAAAAASARATRLILDTQVMIGGKRTIWGQQHDALTGKPVGARNFEPASLASLESIALLDYLMNQPDRTPEVETAVAAGVAWLRRQAIRDLVWQRNPPADGGNKLVPTPGAPLLWSRLFALDTQQPIFADRDRTIHDDLASLSPERRNGYSWYTDAPNALIARYEIWRTRGRGRAREKRRRET